MGYPNNHRAHLVKAEEWTKRIHKLRRHKSTLVKCSICEEASRRKPLTRQAFKKLTRP